MLQNCTWVSILGSSIHSTVSDTYVKNVMFGAFFLNLTVFFLFFVMPKVNFLKHKKNCIFFSATHSI